MIQTKFVEKIRTYTLFSTYFFPESRNVWEMYMLDK